MNKASRSLQPLVLNGIDIKWKGWGNGKYLGVTLDRRLNFSRHTHIVLGKAYKHFPKLCPLQQI